MNGRCHVEAGAAVPAAVGPRRGSVDQGRVLLGSAPLHHPGRRRQVPPPAGAPNGGGAPRHPGRGPTNPGWGRWWVPAVDALDHPAGADARVMATARDVMTADPDPRNAPIGGG